MHALVLLFALGVSGSTFENVTVKWKSNQVVATFDNLKEVVPDVNGTDLDVTVRGTVGGLPEGAVADIDNLETLVMNGVGLRKIEPGAFKNLPRLGHLFLSHNKLSEIHERTFAGLRLSRLVLDNNQISVIHPGAFGDLKLRHLTLSFNQIAKIGPNVFADGLTHLNLYGNSIVGLEPGCFPSTLESLILDSNKLRKIDPEIFNLPEVRSLHLSFNDIDVLRPGDLDNLPKVTNLELVENELVEIPEGVFNSLNITQLDLNYNKIDTIASTAFDNMTTLSVLHIDHNNLTKWDNNWLQNTPRLAYIVAGFNRIAELPAAAFKNYPRMYSIDIQSNQIGKIDDRAFDGLENVVNFNLQDNDIQKWDENLLSNASIGTIDLSGNKLACIEGDLEATFGNVDLVHLGGNPWESECEEKVEEFLKKKVVMPRMRSYVGY